MSIRDKLRCGIDIQSATEYSTIEAFICSLKNIRVFSSPERSINCHRALSFEYEKFFCLECNDPLGKHAECERCHNFQDRYEYDADRAYDEWKDRMLENENSE